MCCIKLQGRFSSSPILQLLMLKALVNDTLNVLYFLISEKTFVEYSMTADAPHSPPSSRILHYPDSIYCLQPLRMALHRKPGSMLISTTSSPGMTHTHHPGLHNEKPTGFSIGSPAQNKLCQRKMIFTKCTIFKDYRKFNHQKKQLVSTQCSCKDTHDWFHVHCDDIQMRLQRMLREQLVFFYNVHSVNS